MHIHVYNDPGHGWGKVSQDQLKRLGLTFGDFSSFSYRRNEFIYLEEDCDLSFFIKKHVEVLGKAPTFRDHTGNKPSRIRGYPSNLPGDAYRNRAAAEAQAREAANSEAAIAIGEAIVASDMA